MIISLWIYRVLCELSRKYSIRIYVLRLCLLVRGVENVWDSQMCSACSYEVTDRRLHCRSLGGATWSNYLYTYMSLIFWGNKSACVLKYYETISDNTMHYLNCHIIVTELPHNILIYILVSSHTEVFQLPPAS